MRRLLLPLLLVPMVLTGCAELLDTAAATVNGTKISEEEFAQEVDFLLADPRFAQPQNQGGREQRQELARQYLTFVIHQQLIEDYAAREGIDVPSDEVQAVVDQQIAELGGREQYQQVLARADVTEAQARAVFEQQVVRRHVAEAVVAERVSDDQLQQTFAEREREFAQVHVAHILVDSKARAERILRRATPQNFGDLAEELSQDPTSAPNGGDLGPQRAVDLLGPFANAALRIPIGEIGGPVQTELGFHLIHVIDRQTLSFEQARPQLLEEVTGDVFTEWLLDLVGRADIRVNPRYGYFDEETASVQPRTSSTPIPGPTVQLAP